MARSRQIKPGYFQNEALADCGPLAQLLFAGLWVHADKAGRLEDRPRRLKVQCLPFYDADVDALLATLSGAVDPFIIRYKVNGHRYIQIVKWHQNQTPHHMEAETQIPPFISEQVEHDSTTNGERLDNAPSTRSAPIENKNKNKEENKEGGTGETKRFVPPSVDDVAAYCRDRSNKVDPATFVDFYTAKGWKVGNQAMRDWRAALRTWEKSDRNRGSPGKVKVGASHLFDPSLETRDEI